MEESSATYVPGVRTAPIRYDNYSNLKKVKERKFISQPVRQGNKKYTISPIYSIPISVKETGLEEGPSLVLRKKD